MILQNTRHQIAYSGILIALGTGLGYALAFVPNVELIALCAFCAGTLLQPKFALFSGLAMFALFSAISPFGIAPIPVFAAQCVGGLFYAMLGLLMRKLANKMIFCALAGFIGTFFYDLLTNATGFVVFPTEDTFFLYMLGGMSFAVIHVISNTVIFAIIAPLLSRITTEKSEPK